MENQHLLSPNEKRNASSSLFYNTTHDGADVAVNQNPASSSNIAIVTPQKPHHQHSSSSASSTSSSCCSKKCGICSCSVIALLLAIIGFLLIFWVPVFVNQKINDELSLKNPTTMLYQGFRNQSHEVQIRFVYNFFNITNWEDVQSYRAKPNVAVAGEYVYIRTKWKCTAFSI